MTVILKIVLGFFYNECVYAILLYLLLTVSTDLTPKSYLRGAGSCYNAETQNKKPMPGPGLNPK